MKTQVIGATLALMVISGATAVVIDSTPTFNDIVHPCMSRESEVPPAQRLNTCTCVAERARTPIALIQRSVSTTSGRDLVERARLNDCRAAAFSQAINAASDTRMSPLTHMSMSSVP